MSNYVTMHSSLCPCRLQHFMSTANVPNNPTTTAVRGFQQQQQQRTSNAQFVRPYAGTQHRVDPKTTATPSTQLNTARNVSSSQRPKQSASSDLPPAPLTQNREKMSKNPAANSYALPPKLELKVTKSSSNSNKGATLTWSYQN